MSEREAPKERPKTILVGVQRTGVSEEEFKASLDELERLSDTLGLKVVGRISQRRKGLAAGVVLGEGKLKDLARLTGGSGVVPKYVKPGRRGKDGEGDEEGEAEAEAEAEPQGGYDAEAEHEEGADAADAGGDADGKPVPLEQRATVIVVDHDLTPTQQRNLERATDAEVHDRTSVILAIFHRHARTREARLQVEIARLNYLAPRLRDTGASHDRQRGGVGGRGAGESALELDRRKIRDRIAELKRELGAIEHSAQTRRAGRHDVATVALVGYTNAGKSSLMRALTGSDIYIANQLFATLDTTVRSLQPRTHPPILVSDTVGFIKKLPHDLVASFRSTLEEAREANLLIHVVDAADPVYLDHIHVTEEVLAEIGAGGLPTLLVLNKEDLIDDARRAELAAAHPDAVVMSAKRPADVARLRARLIAFFEKDMSEVELIVPYAQQRVVHEIHESCHVLAERFEEDGTHVRVRASDGVVARLRRSLGLLPEVAATDAD